MTLLASCSDSREPGLLTTPDTFKVCAPTDPEGYIGFGVGAVQNTLESDILISHIEFIDPENLTLVGASLEDVGSPLRGTDYERSPIAQTWVPLLPGEQTGLSVLAKVENVTDVGSMKGVRIYYKSESSRVEKQNTLDFWFHSALDGDLACDPEQN